MRCPFCDEWNHETQDACSNCGSDLATVRETQKLKAFRPHCEDAMNDSWYDITQFGSPFETQITVEGRQRHRRVSFDNPDHVTEWVDGLPPDSNCFYDHVTPTPQPCDHDWGTGPGDPETCIKCGMSFTRYIFTECP